MGVLAFFLVSYLLLCFGLSLLFKKANISSSKAWIPGINFAEWAKLVGRKPIFALWLLFPIVNVFIYAGLTVDMVRSFGKNTFMHSFWAVVAAPIYFILLGKDEELSYQGPILTAEKQYKEKLIQAHKTGQKRKFAKLQEENPFRKSTGREWGEAIIFAVGAAALIRLFVFEMYTIPTSSMEGSLLVGDYLLVSKAHYGIRTPQTIAMVPLIHNRMPVGNSESYLKWPNLDMYRLPALESIDRNDPIVFNFPLGDSVYVMPGRTWSAEDVRYGNANPDHLNAIRKGSVKMVTRPVDKKDHYVKRAVAVAGDTVEIRSRDLYLNGERAEDAEAIQFRYIVSKPESLILDLELLDEWGITNEDLSGRNRQEAQIATSRPKFFAVLNQDQKQKLKQRYPEITIEDMIDEPGTAAPYQLFPHDPKNFGNWTKDNFGPIYVPKKGASVAIGPNNIALYRRVISVYEGHDLEVKNGAVFIDGNRATEYTFEQDYFWAMGDNRHSSEDSRFWGFVPMDHIVGKPLFIWLSTKNGSLGNGIRWNRLFSGATKM